MSDNTDSNHRTPLSSSSSTPSGTSALSVKIEAEPAAQPRAVVARVDAVSSPDANAEPLEGEPADPVIASTDAEIDEAPPAPFDEDAPLDGEPGDPVIATEVEQAEAIAPEPVEEAVAAVEVAETDPVVAEIPEDVAEAPVAAAPGEADAIIDEIAEVPAPVAAAVEAEAVQADLIIAEIAEDAVAEAALADEAEIVQDNIPDAVSEALPDEPADETPAEPEIARLVLVPQEPDEQTQKLRAAVRETLAQNEAKQDRVLQVFGQASAHLKTALDEAGQDAARITFKLMEFAQANVRNNLEFARDYVAVRSVPDIFDLQAAYFKRQMALMNSQAEEFRKLTAELTAKTAAPVKGGGKALTTGR